MRARTLVDGNGAQHPTKTGNRADVARCVDLHSRIWRVNCSMYGGMNTRTLAGFGYQSMCLFSRAWYPSNFFFLFTMQALQASAAIVTFETRSQGSGQTRTANGLTCSCASFRASTSNHVRGTRLVRAR